jgi:hypothetical protein
MSWYFGTIVAAVFYYAFCKIWPPYESFVDEAVFELDGSIWNKQTPSDEESSASDNKEDEKDSEDGARNVHVLPVVE